MSGRRKVEREVVKKEKWTPEQDKRLIDSIRKHGLESWVVIAKDVRGRTGKQCRERWLSALNPSISKERFTKEEDNMILEMQREMGNKWTIIASYLSKGRTAIGTKNRYNWLKNQQQKKKSEIKKTAPPKKTMNEKPLPIVNESPAKLEATLVNNQQTQLPFNYDESINQLFSAFNHNIINWFE